MPENSFGIDFPVPKGSKPTYLVFDVEATGLPLSQEAPASDYDNWPRALQVAWLIFDETGGLIREENRYINHGIEIPRHSTQIHGIDSHIISEKGEDPSRVLNHFLADLQSVQYVIGHNVDFDIAIIESELHRLRSYNPFAGKYKFCTMHYGRSLCRIPADNGQGFKYPSLEELFLHCSSSQFKPSRINGLHNAAADASYTAAIFFDLLNQNKSLLHHCKRIPYQFPELRKPKTKKTGSFIIKLVLPTLMSFTLFILLAFVLVLPRFRNNIMTEKRLMIKELTTTAWSILSKYHNDQVLGLLSESEAKEKAAGEIRNLRYGDELKDYFWITDLEPIMVMHPYRPDLNGSNLSRFSDPKGKFLFSEFVSIAKAGKEGYLDYQWQWKDDSTLIVPKLSFVKLFEPWGWIIGTGIYIDDAEKEISLLTSRLWIISILVTLLIAALLGLILNQSFRIEKRRLLAEQELMLAKEKYRTLVESSSNGLLMIMDQKIVFANHALEEISGYMVEELLDQPVSLLFEGNPIIMNCVNENTGIATPVDSFFRGVAGQLIKVNLSISQVQLINKSGLIISISNQNLKSDFENQSLELIKKIGFGYFTASLTKELVITGANENVLQLFGADSLSTLMKTDLLILLPDADGWIERFRISRELLNESIIIRRMDGGLGRAKLSLLLLDETNCQGLISDAQADYFNASALQHYQTISMDYLSPVRQGILEAETIDALKQAYRHMQQMVLPLIKAGVPSLQLTRTISETADLITQRLIELGLRALGPAPTPFQFISLGSQARSEMTLATDQDNAIMFLLQDGQEYADIQVYFLKLGAFVCDHLNHIGYAWCKGEVMAKNPNWCISKEQWEKMIATWITHSSPEDLLRSSIFFDLRPLYITDGLEIDLNDFIRKQLARNDLYFLHMARSLATAAFVPSKIISGNTISLKKCLMPITAGMRLYALRHGVSETNSISRATALSGLCVLEEDYVNTLMEIHRLISSIRLEIQARQLLMGEDAGNETLMNDLSEIQRLMLQWSFKKIEAFQTRLKTDFAGLLE